jgi:hypothetical protein
LFKLGERLGAAGRPNGANGNLMSKLEKVRQQLQRQAEVTEEIERRRREERLARKEQRLGHRIRRFGLGHKLALAVSLALMTLSLFAVYRSFVHYNVMGLGAPPPEDPILAGPGEPSFAEPIPADPPDEMTQSEGTETSGN